MKEVIRLGKSVGFEGRFMIDEDGNLRSNGPDLRLAGLDDRNVVMLFTKEDDYLPGAGREAYARVVSVDAELVKLDWKTRSRPLRTTPGDELRVYVGTRIENRSCSVETFAMKHWVFPAPK